MQRASEGGVHSQRTIGHEVASCPDRCIATSPCAHSYSQTPQLREVLTAAVVLCSYRVRVQLPNCLPPTCNHLKSRVALHCGDVISLFHCESDSHLTIQCDRRIDEKRVIDASSTHARCGREVGEMWARCLRNASEMKGRCGRDDYEFLSER
eukprot:73486-Pleurochrysis_carterae.AAC.2